MSGAPQRPRRRRGALPRRVPVCLALGLALGLLPAAVRGAEPFPFALAIEVGYDDGVGPHGLAEELAAEVFENVSARGCYRRVQLVEEPGERGDADLVLRLTLGRLRQEVRYEIGVAERADPVDPSTRQRLWAHFDLDVRVEWIEPSSGTVLKSVVRRAREAVRPIMPGHEDDYAREEARRRGVAGLARSVSAAACKGSARKLARRVEQARAQAPGPPGAR